MANTTSYRTNRPGVWTLSFRPTGQGARTSVSRGTDETLFVGPLVSNNARTRTTISRLQKMCRGFLKITIVVAIVFVVLSSMQRYLVHFVTESVRRKQAHTHKLLYSHFDVLCGPVFPVTPIVNRGVDRVDCSRNGRGEYKVLAMPDLAPLVERDQKKGIRRILERVLPHLKTNDSTLSVSDVVVVDIIASKGAYFPSMHTDVEWTFYPNDGFQVWMLLDNPKEEGNMFLFETDDVHEHGGGASVKVVNDKLMMKKTTSPSQRAEWRDLSIRKTLYLAFQRGDLVVFNQNMLHMSDFRTNAKSRFAINFRVLIRDPCRRVVFRPFNGDQANLLLKLCHMFKFWALCGKKGVCPLFGPSV